MKRIFTILVIVVMACRFTASAQIWVDGSLGFYFNNCDTYKYYNFTVAPQAGYDLSDKWAVGAELSYSCISYKYDSGYHYTTNAFGIEPFVRYSFFKKDIVTLFVDGAVGYSYNKYNDGYEPNSSYIKPDKLNVISVGFRPGIKIDIAEHLAIEAHTGILGYSHSFVNDDSDYSESLITDSFGLAINQAAVNFGLIYNF